MIDWDKISNSHVLKTFRVVSNKWWGTDVQLYDRSGNSRSENISLKNPLCHLINKTADGAKLCSQSRRKNVISLNKTKQPFVFKCHCGLYGSISPMLNNGNCVGAMICSGILPSKKEPGIRKYIREITNLGFDKTSVEQVYGNLKVINGHSEKYLVDLMEMVTEDVMAFYELQQEKIKLVRARSAFNERINCQKYKGIIGVSPAINKIFETLELLEESELPVLIEGESGTGKELLSAAIHFNSPRRDKNFIIQNCSAFSDTLMNSELFGHEKGAFTGATSDKKGLFEISDGGTLFLDEIGDIDLKIQAKLLRIIENGTFYRLGGTEERCVNVRIIVATNKSIKALVEQKLFREDLYYRINSILIEMPPLRERRGDISILVNYFLENLPSNNTGERKEMSSDVLEMLKAYDWPGNVRQLRNEVQRMVVLSGNYKLIELHHISQEILTAHCSSGSLKAKALGESKRLKTSLDLYEKDIVENCLRDVKWNKSIASKELGISRSSLNDKIIRLKIIRD